MTWLTWRLQRTELVLLGLILLVLGGALLRTHADLVAESKRYTADTCPVPLSGGELACIVPVSRLYLIVNQWLEWFDVIPLLAALLLALPVVLELENGTYRLAWTQGATRAHWVRTKFGILGLCGLAFAALFALAFHWWSSPMDQISGRLQNDWYDLRGTLPIGYTLFAIGLMLAVGTVLRRPVLAIILASVSYLAVLMPISLWLRPHLIPPLTEPTSGVSGPGTSAQERAEGSSHSLGDWLLSQQYRDPTGNLLSTEEYSALCANAQATKDTAWQCIAENGLVSVTTYHPASHY